MPLELYVRKTNPITKHSLRYCRNSFFQKVVQSGRSARNLLEGSLVLRRHGTVPVFEFPNSLFAANATSLHLQTKHAWRSDQYKVNLRPRLSRVARNSDRMEYRPLRAQFPLEFGE